MFRKVSIIAYMNTNRDNFYDWAKDKPDTTSFAGFDRTDLSRQPARSGVPWGRMAAFVMVAVAVVAALKLYVL